MGHLLYLLENLARHLAKCNKCNKTLPFICFKNNYLVLQSVSINVKTKPAPIRFELTPLDSRPCALLTAPPMTMVVWAVLYLLMYKREHG